MGRLGGFLFLVVLLLLLVMVVVVVKVMLLVTAVVTGVAAMMVMVMVLLPREWCFNHYHFVCAVPGILYTMPFFNIERWTFVRCTFHCYK